MIKNKFLFAAVLCGFAFLARPSFAACEDLFTDFLVSGIEWDGENEKMRLLTTDQEVIDFFVKNFDQCRSFLVSKGDKEFEFSFDNQQIEADVLFSWQQIREAVAALKSADPTDHAVKVCENNRSYQVGLDVVLWTATAISAAATFWAGGTGGAVTATITQSAKVAAKAAAKQAITRAARTVASQTARSAAKKAAIQAVKKAQVELLKKSIKAAMSTKLARYGIKPGVAVAITYFGGQSVASVVLGKTYSLLESGLTKDYVNCQDLDTSTKKWGGSEFCYRVCGENALSKKPDSLNKYVMTPMFKKTYCIDRKDFGLYEMNPNGSAGKLFTYGDPNIWAKIKAKIVKEIQNKKGCDWSSDDVDVYTGFLMYSSKTLSPTEGDGGMQVLDTLRIDD